MKLLRWLGIALAVAIVLVLLVLGASRFADGPLLPMIAGGPLEAGELVTVEPDWAFVRDVNEIEFQLLDPARSRIVWVIEHDGNIYIPCGFISAWLWKQWPHEAMADGRALLRIEGKRYARDATRVTDLDEYRAVLARASEKYGGLLEAPADFDDETWVFRLDPRSP